MVMIENDIPKEPYELFGVECCDGWNKLIKQIIEYVENYNKDKNDSDKIVICQIKEKFGELCIYVDNSTKELDDMIRYEEDESLNTCELCGSTSNVGHTTKGWITTMCKDCASKQAVRARHQVYWLDNETRKLYAFDENGNCREIEKSKN